MAMALPQWGTEQSGIMTGHDVWHFLDGLLLCAMQVPAGSKVMHGIVWADDTQITHLNHEFFCFYIAKCILLYAVCKQLGETASS